MQNVIFPDAQDEVRTAVISWKVRQQRAVLDQLGNHGHAVVTVEDQPCAPSWIITAGLDRALAGKAQL